MAIISATELVKRASTEIVTLSAKEALKRQATDQAILVDIRDIRELDREGRIEGALHAPRGMLEFWFDPQSKYHREVFAEPETGYILFCGGGWRSALAAKSLQDMGFTNIAHIEGGFGALVENGAKIAADRKS